VGQAIVLCGLSSGITVIPLVLRTLARNGFDPA